MVDADTANAKWLQWRTQMRLTSKIPNLFTRLGLDMHSDPVFYIDADPLNAFESLIIHSNLLTVRLVERFGCSISTSSQALRFCNWIKDDFGARCIYFKYKGASAEWIYCVVAIQFARPEDLTAFLLEFA